ncbi:PLDc N-terminal domain-containing protein [Cellulomonas sp. NPDC057328]|uniref:PLDc N-terminal domain-containing protein n=1 Tax=Cellulomonas sp. NPDC057328 TaxID=3346101 RepID=UPI00362F76A2
MLRYLPYLVALALAIYCVIDVLRSDERTRRGLPTPLWLALVVLVPLVGPVTWLVLRRGGDGAGPARRRPTRPVAPDDDPEFLRRLDQERRRRERGSGGPADGAEADDAAGGDPTPT